MRTAQWKPKLPGLVLVPVLLLTLVWSCKGLFEPQIAPGAVGQDGMTAAAQRALPGLVSLDSSLYRYDLIADGSSGAGFAMSDLQASDFPWTWPLAIEPGTWTVVVSLKDTGGLVIGRGSGNAAVTIEEIDSGPVDFAIQPVLLPGNGTLDFSLSWDPAELPAGTAGFELLLDPRPSGTAVDLGTGSQPADFDPGAGTATWQGRVSAGSYLLRTRLLLDGQTVWGHAEALLILAEDDNPDGMETSLAIDLPSGTMN